MRWGIDCLLYTSCVPCRIGLGQLEKLLEKVLDNEATMETLDLIEEVAENIKNSSDCAIGFESARMAVSYTHLPA